MRSPLGARSPRASALGCAQGGRLRAGPACARVRGAAEAGAPVRPFVPQTHFSRVALSSGSAYPPRSARFSACARGRDGIAWGRGEQHVSGGGGKGKSHSVGFQFQTRGEQANPALRRGPSAGRAQRVHQTEGRARAPSAQRDQGRGEGPGRRRPGGCERARLAGLRLRSCCRVEGPGLWAVPGPGGPEASDSGRT